MDATELAERESDSFSWWLRGQDADTQARYCKHRRYVGFHSALKYLCDACSNELNEKQPAIICDRDGTLFSVAHHRVGDGIADWHSFNGLAQFDRAVPEIASLLRAVRPGVAILITSGRMERARWQFLMAMGKHEVPFDRLFMRRDGDQRRDSAVKLEMYRERIEPYYDVRYVIDDRPQVVDMWRSIGLSVLQVTDPGLTPMICGGRIEK